MRTGVVFPNRFNCLKKSPIKKLVIITGPTGVGKTAVAIDVATHFETEIISADSRQCFREMEIGVARPSAYQLKQVPHHFIASHSIHEEITAADFEQYALQKTKSLFKQHDIVVMTGGTGLYIKAFCTGLDSIPAIPAELRTAISKNYEHGGLQWLQDEIRKKDPAFYKSGEIKNPQRMMRALEVMEHTGQSILQFQKGKKVIRDFNIIKIGLEIPRDQLRERIDKRVDQMMENGLLHEVKRLYPFKTLNALQTVGYTELFDFLEGKVTLDIAIANIKTHTRQYAKRQRTWFKKDKEIIWCPPHTPVVLDQMN